MIKTSRTGFMPSRRHKLTAILLLLVLLVAACRAVDGSASEARPTRAATDAAPASTEAGSSPAATPVQQTGPVAVTEVAQTTQAPAPTEPTSAAPSGEAPQTAVNSSLAMLPAAQADLAALPDIPQYYIDLQIEPSLASFSGQMRVDYVNLEDQPLDRVYFRLLPNGGKSYGNGSLAVDAAWIDGEPLQTVQPQDDASVLEAQLPAPLPAGGRIQLELDFIGQVPEDFGGQANPLGYGIYNLTDGILALSGWYPILAVYDEDGWNLDPVSAEGDSVYSDTAFYSVKVCAPSGVIIASTGVETGQEQSGDVICRQIESGPARDFMLMGSREYQRLSAEVDGTMVYSYYLPGHEDAAQKVLDISARSLEIYNEKFGAYPFVELDVMDAPMRNALGVEFPGIILVASSLYDEPAREDFDVATAHEVGHQWWYGVIGNDVFEEPWLDEALTTFTSTLYYEFGRSGSAAQGLWDFWQERYDRLVQSGRDDPVAESLSYFESDPANRSYATVVYVKGGLFFNALRKEIGDEAFFAALQQYYQTHKYGIARGQDLLDAFAAAAGRPLDDFYQQWLYQ